MERPRGFSLIEVMIVVAIVAILTALATQSYTRYLFRSRRIDARHALLAIASSEERWYATYNRYTDDIGKLGYAEPAVSPQGYYALSVSVTDADEQGFIATATPLERQAQDACGSLSIDNAGHKLPAPTDAATHANGDCW